MAIHTPSSSAAGFGARRPRPWLWPLIAVAALATGVAVGHWVLPGDSSGSTGGLGAPHGPARVTDGVPSGYTRDQAGAATAAANVIQVQVAAAHGQADADTVTSTWLASTADDKTRTALSRGRNTDGQDQTNKLPASTRVTAFDEDTATVEVWVASVGSTSGLGGGTLTAASWSTATYRLVWEAADWKVVTFSSVSGPKPGETSSTTKPALTNGLYTFYTD